MEQVSDQDDRWQYGGDMPEGQGQHKHQQRRNTKRVESHLRASRKREEEANCGLCEERRVGDVFACDSTVLAFAVESTTSVIGTPFYMGDITQKPRHVYRSNGDDGHLTLTRVRDTRRFFNGADLSNCVT